MTSQPSNKAQPLDICVIAPEAAGCPPLQWGRELGNLADVDGVHLVWVGGPDVRDAQVAKVLRMRHDVVIWSGHGGPNALYLPNGRVLRGRWIASQVRAGAPRAFVLAACGSGCTAATGDNLAWQIAKSGINVIGFPDAMRDEPAIVYNTEFVRALVAGADVGEAHDVALEAIEEGWKEESHGIQLLPGLTNGYRFLIERLNAQDDRLSRLESGQSQIVTMLQQALKLPVTG